MKISAFVLGGIAGAAAVMLLRKQSFSALAGGMSQMMRGGEAKKGLRGMPLSVLFGSGGGSEKSSTGKESAASSGSSPEPGIERIAHIASKDEGVKKEINEILEQNDQPQI